MKLELPEDHPLARAIREATENSASQVTVSVHSFGRSGTGFCIASFNVGSWAVVETKEKHFETEMVDTDEYQRALEAMTKWPESTFEDQS